MFGYRFGYWQDVGRSSPTGRPTLLLEDRPELDLYDSDWIIHTCLEERAAKVGSTTQIHREPDQPRLP